MAEYKPSFGGEVLGELSRQVYEGFKGKAPPPPPTGFQLDTPKAAPAAPASPPPPPAGFALDQPRPSTMRVDVGGEADPVKAWATQEAANEPKPPLGYRGVGPFINGLPILGGLANDATAGVHTVAQKVLGNDGKAPYSYEQNRALLTARNDRDREDSTTVATIPDAVPYIGGSKIKGYDLNSVVGGTIATPAMPFAQLFKGGGFLANTANMALNGGAYGAADGLTRGKGGSGKDRIEAAVEEGKEGGAFGALIPAAARGISAVASRMPKALPPELAKYHPDAVKAVGEAAEANGVTINPQGRAQRAPDAHGRTVDLGEDGMLADMGPTLQRYAGGLAARPDANPIIAPRIMTRTEMAPDRIGRDVNNAFGARQNLPEYIDRVAARYGKAAAPHYEQFYKTPIPATDELVSILHSLPDEVWAGASKLAKFDRVDLRDAINNGHGLDLVKRSIDDIAKSAMKNGNNNLERIATKSAKSLREEVDKIISPNDPTQSPWFKGRAIAGDGLSIKDAVEEGRKAFSRGTSPDQLAYDMKGDSALEAFGKRIGARSQVADTMGNKATAFGPKGDTAARQMFNSEYGRDKLHLIARPGQAQRLTNRIDAENIMAATNDKVLNGSDTAARLEFSKVFPNPKDKSSAHNWTFEGTVAAQVLKLKDMVTAGRVTANNIKIATDAAKMLVAQGADRDAIARGLLSHIRNGNVTNAQRTALTRIANQVLFSTGRAAIATGESVQRPNAR